MDNPHMMLSRRLTFVLTDPLSLLLIGGFSLAVTFNLAKAAAINGLSPVQLSFAAALGAGLLLLYRLRRANVRLPLTWPHIRAYFVLGVVSFAIPTSLGVLIGSTIGASYTSVIGALSPLITLTLATLLRLEPWHHRRLAGLALGLIGTLVLLKPSGHELTVTDGFFYMALGLLIPLSNGTGNVLRSLLIPPGTPTNVIATGVLLAAAALLGPIVALSTPEPVVALSTLSWNALLIMIASAAATAAANLALFQLQKVAGPVRLSQIGYVSAGFGVVLAILSFGEIPSISLILGMILIVIGIRVTARTYPPRPPSTSS